MALQLTRRTPGWDGNISGGNQVTLRIPIGLTTHQVYTEYSFQDATCCALALADAIDDIRVILNGKPTWSIKADELDTMNQFDGRAAAGTAGFFTLDFDRFNLRMRSMEELTSIKTGHEDDTNPVTTFTIEMDLKAAVDSGTLDSRVHQSASEVLGIFKKIRRYTDAFTAGSGTFEIDDFPLGDLINRVFFFESANDLSRVRLERDDYVMFDRTDDLNSGIQTDGVRTPQTGLFVYDTSEKGNGTDQLLTRYENGRLINDLRWFMTITGAMTITSLVEYLGGLER